jgi:hypothetical protein
MPFGGAFLAIEGPLQIGHELNHLWHFILRLIGLMRPLTPGHTRTHHEHWWEALIAPWWVVVAGGLFFWLLLHVPPVRSATVKILGVVGHLLKRVLIDAPAALLRWPALRAFLNSRPVRLAARFTLKPLLPAAITWLIITDWGYRTRVAATDGALAYLAAVLFLCTRFSREFEEVTADWATRRWEYVRDFVPGLIRLIVDVFKRALEGLDRGLYAVDEWLRFRGGESETTRWFKTVGGLLWGGVSYVVRFIIVLFVEPQINPIKHFPIVTISHKMLLPMVPTLAGFLIDHYGMEKGLAGTVAFIILGKIPGIFGFLAWELKENWRLYRANRPVVLKPVMIGHHGETLPRLLRPGFHSGTLPKLYAKLRRAERRAAKTANWGAARKHLDGLHHVEEAIHNFADRELLCYVNDTPAWASGPLRLAAVECGSNRVRLELACPRVGTGRMSVTFEEQSGWLLAGTDDPGWRLTEEQSAVLDLALTGFYKVAGVDLLRSDIESALGRPWPYDVCDAGLVVWPDHDAEVLYDLNAEPEIVPHVISGKPPEELPTVSADRLIFCCRPVPWVDWVTAWEQVEDCRNTGA